MGKPRLVSLLGSEIQPSRHSFKMECSIPVSTQCTGAQMPLHLSNGSPDSDAAMQTLTCKPSQPVMVHAGMH